MPTTFQSPLLLTLALTVGGCVSTPPQRPAAGRGATEMPVWLAPEDVERYRCSVGVLVCDDAIGRRSKRLCECVE